MTRYPRAILIWTLLIGTAAMAQVASVTFAPRELFRIPFGKGREDLGAKIEGGSFLFPRDFTIDMAGHFYIYDSNNLRIARFSPNGTYEMGYRYPATAGQVFAHADSRQNLWLLISDPARGIYYGVYDPHGKLLRSGIFSQFTHFHLHVDDNATLHVMLSSGKKSTAVSTYILDEDGLLMKKENIARPPETHHRIPRNDRVYFIDQVPDGSRDDARHVNRITDESHRGIANIKGTVLYVTGQDEIYTRVGEREIHVYDVDGSLKGRVLLEGLPSACASIRFDAQGNLYELDGIPDSSGHYTPAMPGLRLLRWERSN